MVASLFHPLGIFLLGLGGGFLIPLLYRLGYAWLHAGFFIALLGMVVVSGVSVGTLLLGAPTIEVLTAGSGPPISINLRFGLSEGLVAFSVNVVAVLCAISLWEVLRKKYAPLLLFLILVMGINGLIMTRDLFNLFVFIEIVSIGTYGLLALSSAPNAMGAAFKYILATVLASTLFLMGAMLLYHVTGALNIDALLAVDGDLTGPIAVAGLLMVAGCLLIELKPFPANGWGLDVYETAPPGLAAMLSVGASAGFIFAFFKLLPLFDPYLELFAISGAVTYVASNLIGLKQVSVQRLLGYSSIGQMGLLVLALCLLTMIGAEDAIPLVAGGLFINHLLAKAGLFLFSGATGFARVDQAIALATRPILVALLAIFIVAIAALPPFPGFWAKWELLIRLAQAGLRPWIVALLIGSLLEAAYMFRWFVRAIGLQIGASTPTVTLGGLAPLCVLALLLIATGIGAAAAAGAASLWLFAPLLAGAVLVCLEPLPGRLKAVAMLAVSAAAGGFLAQETTGIAGLFSPLLLAGSLVIAAASLYRTDARIGYYPLLAVLIVSIQALLRSETGLEFYFSYEIITLASFFLIAKGREATAHLMPFLLFSLASAFLLLFGFAIVAADTGSTALSTLFDAGTGVSIGYVFLAVGFLIKAAALGVHVWLPGAYAQADDDLTAMLSAVVSKVALFGLLGATYAAIRSDADLDLAYALAWLGMATAILGAAMALAQDDMKRLLAYSSMSQIGYIVMAIALMSHLGWVTALYLVANHMMVKGILFLALAAIILRTGLRSFRDVRGLRRQMPVTFAIVLVAIVSMSGLPPLMGFGGKWLLFSAMAEKGWSLLAIASALATLLGLLYMARIVVGLFFGPTPADQPHVREAPITILVPQVLLIGGIIVLSFFPKLLMGPISAAIDPQFASTLVWEGQSLETIYGIWNPVPVVRVSLAAALILVGLWWVLRAKLAPGDQARTIMFERQLLVRVTPPVAVAFWRGIAAMTLTLADCTRRIYTGNGQTYAALVLIYFLSMYFLAADGAALFTRSTV